MCVCVLDVNRVQGGGGEGGGGDGEWLCSAVGGMAAARRACGVAVHIVGSAIGVRWLQCVCEGACGMQDVEM